MASGRRIDWADTLDTIGYEIVTRIGSRVPREYVEVGHDRGGHACPAMAGRGLLAAGALAAGAALGAVAERSLLRASGAPDPRDEPADFGTLRGDVRSVEASDGTALHVEVDEGPTLPMAQRRTRSP